MDPLESIEEVLRDLVFALEGTEEVNEVRGCAGTWTRLKASKRCRGIWCSRWRAPKKYKSEEALEGTEEVHGIRGCAGYHGSTGSHGNVR